MKQAEKVTEKEIQALKNWEYENDCISRSFIFSNFVEAFGFMSRVALCAERVDHHPDWSNSYRTVNISLTTHTYYCVTQKDILLAQEIDALFKQ